MRYRLVLSLVLCVGLLGVACAQVKPKELPSPVVRPPTEAKSEPGSHVFCVFGDCRPDGDASRLALTSRLASVMADERPELVIGTGDYVDGASNAAKQKQQWNDFLRSFWPLQKHGPVPFAAAVGNHDVSGGMGGIFTGTLGTRYYSFDLARAHFIVLDTEQPGQVGQITGAQWSWLCQDLQAARAAPLIFVVLHEPLFPVSVHRGSSLDKYPKYRDRLHMLFAQMKVSAVFAGHEHLYNHQKRDGVNYFITAGGGAPLYASAPNGGFYHYLKVTFTDREFAVTVQRLSN